VPTARPSHEAAVDGSIRSNGELAKVGARKLWITLSSPGTWMRPANRARKLSPAIAIFIGGACSTM